MLSSKLPKSIRLQSLQVGYSQVKSNVLSRIEKGIRCCSQLQKHELVQWISYWQRLSRRDASWLNSPLFYVAVRYWAAASLLSAYNQLFQRCTMKVYYVKKEVSRASSREQINRGTTLSLYEVQTPSYAIASRYILSRCRCSLVLIIARVSCWWSFFLCDDFFFRFITILYYLNDVEEGGQTAFLIADNTTTTPDVSNKQTNKQTMTSWTVLTWTLHEGTHPLKSNGRNRNVDWYLVELRVQRGKSHKDTAN